MKNGKNKDSILIEFSKKVRLRRHSLGLTQERLAEKGGFHPNFIGGIERATRNPSLITIVKLAKALECSPKELLP